VNPVAAPKLEVARYSLFAAPLAMAALPIYVHVPKFYAELGLSLATLGIVLLVLRFADAFIDPLLGRWADTTASRIFACALGAVGLGVGMLTLLNPQWSPVSLWAWLIFSLILVYLGFSLSSIAHGAWGAELPRVPEQRTTYTATREAVGLIGVLFAAALPAVLSKDNAEGLAKFSWIFVVVLIVALIALWRIREAKVVAQDERAIATTLKDHRFRALLAVFALNGIASAIPATLLLFFVDDVLKAKDWEPQFLVSYFLAGALAMPMWTWLARRYGKVIAWSIGMMLAVIAFIWAVSFSSGDRIPFLIVCIATGVALGADLALPPALLADTIAKANGQSRTGSYFGIWAFVTKANLALAAGLALPIVSALGYQVGKAQSNLAALTYAYTLFPCALKLCALALLWKFKPLFDERSP
jgi:glycoside/pentoside/hexuronide:cation symporter, GPH family